MENADKIWEDKNEDKKKGSELQNPQESQEFTTPIFLEDIATYGGTSIEELARSVVASIVDAARKRPEFEKHYRETYGIADQQDFQQGMNVFADRRIKEFQEHFPRKQKEFKEQAAHCLTFARQHGYIADTRPIHIVITDWFLTCGKPNLTGTDSYDHRTGVTFVGIDRPNILLAHELGHSLSHTQTEKGSQRVGFSIFEPLGGGEEKMHGCQWLNEGTTVLWENQSVNDRSTFSQRALEEDFYPYSRDLAKLLLEKIGVPEEILFKAYFGDREALHFLNDAINRRFKCTMEDLNCLTLKLDIKWAKSILDGQPVTIEILETDHTSIIPEKEQLARIFPNVIIKKELTKRMSGEAVGKESVMDTNS